MSNSNRDDSGFLRDLFSAARKTSPVSAETEIRNHRETTEPAHTTEKARISPPPTSRASQKTARPGLSPLATDVLKAARGELGRSAHQQASGLDAIATERAIGAAIDIVSEGRKEQLSDVERADLIVHLRTDLVGWGVLQPLIDDPRVTDIHVYDDATVVLQRGKVSESTGLH